MVMESLDLYNLTSSSSSSSYHLMESEKDFLFGAKTSSFLPPATAIDGSLLTTITTDSFDLPEWMEVREFLELPDMKPLENTVSLQPLTPQDNTFSKIHDDKKDYFTIKPEDMLVPLSELQPPATPSILPLADTPPASPLQFSTSPVFVPDTPPLVPNSPPQASALAPASQSQASAPLPKIIICRKIDASLKNRPIQVNYQIMPVKQVPRITVQAPLPEQSLRSQDDFKPLVIEPQSTVTSVEVPQPQGGQPCDAEDLINEMVEMIGTNNSAASTIFEGLDTEVEADMEELLLQLEASNKETVNSEPLSVPLPAPSPSTVESLSPFSTETTVLGSLSPPHSESTFPSSPLSLPSPVPSLGSLSPAQSSCDALETSSVEDCLEEIWSPVDTHSYSKSLHKARPARRTRATRKTPYAEHRKERKKEQNKQAALRYRQKKKQEEDDIMSKIRVEEERQEKLTTTYKSLKQELSYLKKIMREVFVAKGLLSEEALKKAAMKKKKASK